MFLRIALFFLPLACFCQPQYRFDHFSIRDGLSQNTVNCVLKDKQGYYWFGTQDGLNLYDGYTVKVFRHDRNDSTTISDNFILCIKEDAFGNFWVGTRNGLNFLDRSTGAFTWVVADPREKKDYHNNIWSVVVDGAGNVFYSNTYSQLIRIGQDDAVAPPFHPRVISEGSKLSQSSDSTWCIAERNKNLLKGYSFHSARPEWEIKTDGMTIGRIFCDDGKYLLCGIKEGLAHFGKKDLSAFTVHLAGKTINVVFRDKKQHTWIGTTEGLYLYDKPDFFESPSVFIHSATDPYSISDNNVQSIYEDEDGLIWIGTAEGGVNVYDPGKDVFRTYTTSSSVKLSGNGAWGIYLEKNELWVGTSNGLDHFIFEKNRLSDPSNKAFETKGSIDASSFYKSFSGSVVTSVIKDKQGNIWVGGYKGITIFDPVKNSWKSFSKGVSGEWKKVFHLMCTSTGKIWISTIDCFYRYDPVSGKLDSFLSEAYPGGEFPSGYIFSTYEDGDGTIWVGSTRGIFHLDANGKKIKFYFSEEGNPNSLSYNMGTSFLRDSRGRLWVTTLGGGIDNISDEGKFYVYTKKVGLANDITYRIVEDKEGLLWISTNSGLSCFDPDKQVFVNYTDKDGLVASEFTQNAAFVNNAGELLFGSPEGLVVFDPLRVRHDRKDPPVLLTGLKVNYENRDYVRGSPLELSYEDRTVSFEFASPDFSRQHRMVYYVQLSGFDSDWREMAPSERSVSYTNLPFGNYVFAVRVKCDGFKSGSKSLEIPVNVIPPFWLRTWFIVLEIFVFIILVVVIVRYYSVRKLRKQMQEIEMQQMIYKERERISRDLHDNVGANLTYITSTLDNIALKSNKENSEQRINSLSDFTRSTMQQLRETIWAINKDSVLLSELKDKVTDYGVRMTESAGMEFLIECSGEDVLLKPSTAINIYRLIQEAVNNAVKHSGADRLTVRMNRTNREIMVSVTDNGKGMQQKEREGGYGLKNMENRVKELGGKVQFKSQNGKGTSVEMVFLSE